MINNTLQYALLVLVAVVVTGVVAVEVVGPVVSLFAEAARVIGGVP